MGMPLGKERMLVCLVLRAKKFSLSLGTKGELGMSDLVSSTKPVRKEMV